MWRPLKTHGFLAISWISKPLFAKDCLPISKVEEQRHRRSEEDFPATLWRSVFLVGATPKYCDLTHSKYWICSYLKLALAGNFCVCLLPRNGELPWIHHQSIAELPCATDHQALDYFSVPLAPSLQNRVITVRAVREPKIGQWRRRLGIIPPLYTFEDDPFLSFFHSKPSRLGKVYPLGHCHRRWYLYIYTYTHILLYIEYIYII